MTPLTRTIEDIAGRLSIAEKPEDIERAVNELLAVAGTVDTESEQAWRNGWGSAIVVMRTAREIGDGQMLYSAEDKAARKAIGKLFNDLLDIIETKTDGVVAMCRVDPGLASPAVTSTGEDRDA